MRNRQLLKLALCLIGVASLVLQGCADMNGRNGPRQTVRFVEQRGGQA